MINKVLFDTNIYGYILEDEDSLVMKEILTDYKKFNIIGTREIRRELKKTNNKKLKNALLRLYEILKSKELQEGSAEEKLASIYHLEAKKLGKEKIKS